MERYGTTFVKVYSVREWLERIFNVPQSSNEWLNNPVYILLICVAVVAVCGLLYYCITEGLMHTKIEEPPPTDTENEAEGDREEVVE